jgi:hypothetical protein
MLDSCLHISYGFLLYDVVTLFLFVLAVLCRTAIDHCEFLTLYEVIYFMLAFLLC